MMKQTDGIYRWTYELNMYRNPTVLITVLKVLGLSMGLVWLFVVLVSIGDRGFWWDEFLSETKVFALVMLGFVVLGAIAYYLYALIQGGRYCVLFEMDEQGVKHTQLARQFKRAQVVAALTTFAGAATGNPTVMGSGILAGSRASLYSDFASVKKISAVKERNVIYLDARLNHNQVYVEDADFDEVYDFIAARCVNAKGRGRRKTRKDWISSMNTKLQAILVAALVAGAGASVRTQAVATPVEVTVKSGDGTSEKAFLRIRKCDVQTVLPQVR